MSEAEAQELNEEINLKKNDDGTFDSGKTDMVAPTWSKVSKDNHRRNFLKGRLEETIGNGSDKELFKGAKIKDIDGSYSYAEQIDEDIDSDTYGEKIKVEDSDYFEFRIPFDSSLTWSYVLSDVTIQNNESITDGSASEFIFRVNFFINCFFFVNFYFYFKIIYRFFIFCQ